MRRDDIINILCKLKYSCDDFPTMQTSFLYEFGDREYEIKFERDAGRVAKFHLTDIGLSREGQKAIQEELEVVNENN